VGNFTHISGETLAQISDLTITYSPEGQRPVRALQGVSLDIQRGEVIGVLGESGSGKSTLASALLRLLPSYAQYNSGGVCFRGRDLLGLRESEMRRIRGADIVLIPQEPALALNPVMRVGTQISEVLRAHSKLTRAQRADRVQELLLEVGFANPAEIGSAYPHQLSGGQRQRITIAQAIACRPALIIADEPTSKLDGPLQHEIVDLISDIRKRHGIAFLFISHDPSLFRGFADRLVVMYAGRIIEEGSAKDVFEKPLHPYTRALLALANTRILVSGVASRVPLPAIEGEAPELEIFHIGCHYEPRCADRMHLCAGHDPSRLMPEPAHSVACFKYDD
jgi:oligopeptide/dipeptide ABC transporter ATP-binding protein